MVSPPSPPPGRERPQGARRPDAPGLDPEVAPLPRPAVVRRAVGGPGEAVRLDVVVADPPERRPWARHAEPLLEVHLRADLAAGADVLQPGARLRRDELPPVLGGVVRPQRRRRVVRLAAVADDAVLVQDLRP